MFHLLKTRGTLGLLDVIAVRTSGCYMDQIFYSTANASSIEFVESEVGSLMRDILPAGSALFQEDNHFSPVVRPDPLLMWDGLERSLIARGRSAGVKLEDLRKMAEEISCLKAQLTSLNELRKAMTNQFTLVENKEETRKEARHLRSKQKETKVKLTELNSHFQKQILSLPNFIHTSYIPGSQNSLEKILECGPVKKLIAWSSVKDDRYVTPTGTFLSGHLAVLEQDLCARTRQFWLKLAKTQIPTYPIALSDFARGPAVEGAAWSNINNALRLEPTRSDLLPVAMNAGTVGRSNPIQTQWLVNPHTSNYLVGSASLASFAAYLLRTKITEPNTLPIRLLSLGSVYMSIKTADKDAQAITLMNSCSNHAKNPREMLPFVQQRQLSLLELTPTWTQCESGFERLTDQLGQFWIQFQPNWAMRVVHIRPDQLRPCEMARSVIELIPKTDSPSVQLASVSLMGDWVSRRIGCKCSKFASVHIDEPENSYVNMVYAQLMDIRSLFAAFEHTGFLEELSLISS